MQAVVAGGGLAGGAVACLLAQAGRDVLLLEREPAPAHKICGEFLSIEAQRYLDRIGLDLGALGGQPITGVRLVRGTMIAEAALPFQGLGLSRRRLDAALLDHAEQCGAQVRRGHRAGVCALDPLVLEIDGLEKIAVRPLATEIDGLKKIAVHPLAAEIDGQAAIQADALFLATGKHDLRPLQRRPSTPPEDLVGFKTYFSLAADQARALQGRVEVILFDHGYAGLQFVEDGQANLCLLARRGYFQRSGGNWDGLLHALQADVPHLQRRLQGAVPLLARPLSIYRVPYGFVHAPSAADPANVYRLGDQAGVIPSFSGDGMSIALHSALLASRAYLSGAGAHAYHQQLRADISSQIRRANALYGLAKRAPLQHLLLRLAGVWPQGLQRAASMTRIPAAAIARALGG